MKQYTVLCDFYDANAHDHLYRAGDLYPCIQHDEPDEKRVNELGSNKNITGIPLINLSKSQKKAKTKEQKKAPAEMENGEDKE